MPPGWKICLDDDTEVSMVYVPPTDRDPVPSDDPSSLTKPDNFALHKHYGSNHDDNTNSHGCPKRWGELCITVFECHDADWAVVPDGINYENGDRDCKWYTEGRGECPTDDLPYENEESGGLKYLFHPKRMCCACLVDHHQSHNTDGLAIGDYEFEVTISVPKYSLFGNPFNAVRRYKFKIADPCDYDNAS
jgi:hypothetical protein